MVIVMALQYYFVIVATLLLESPFGLSRITQCQAFSLPRIAYSQHHRTNFKTRTTLLGSAASSSSSSQSSSKNSSIHHQVALQISDEGSQAAETINEKNHATEDEEMIEIAEEEVFLRPPVFSKTRKEIKSLQRILKTNVLFEGAPPKVLKQMVDAFEKVEYSNGTVIMEQGDINADFMLVLERGKCSISIDGEQLKEPYGTMSQGSMIGELGLLYDSERSATVTAKTNVTAFRLNKDSFSFFMNRLQITNKMEEKDIKKELKAIDSAIDRISGVKTKYGGDIIRQFRPSPFWLWGRWTGTILQHAWKSAVINMLLSATVVTLVKHYFQPPWAVGMIPDPDFPLIRRVSGLSKLWHYLMNITTFILTFFLSQAYGVWREMYRISRFLQGKFSDIGLILASTVERDQHGEYTKEGEALLDDVADYSRLFHAFAWARQAKTFKVILSKRGISRMLSRGLMTRKQYDSISSLNDAANGPQNACITWIIIKCLNAMKARTLPNDHALRDMIFRKTAELRSGYAQIGDLLAGRIPLAYAHFVQILVDSFLFLAPFALYVELGIWSIPAVGLLTLFYSGLLDLAKLLLDPIENDRSDNSKINMDIGVLIRESNASSSQFKYGAEKLPFSTMFWTHS